MDSKPFYKSKTFWFQILAIVLAVASQFGFADFQSDAEMVAVVMAVVNIILRFVTRQAVRLR